jgi:hypothetical protein
MAPGCFVRHYISRVDNARKYFTFRYLNEFEEGMKLDIEKILLDKLPDILDAMQKKHKMKNILQSLKINELSSRKARLGECLNRDSETLFRHFLDICLKMHGTWSHFAEPMGSMIFFQYR